MNTAFNFEAEQFGYVAPGEVRETPYPEQETWEIGAPDAYEYEGGTTRITPPPGLNAAVLARAVAANRVLARRLGWGRVVRGSVQPIPELLTFLGLTTSATQEDVARSVARWQQVELHQAGDGQLDPGTWAAMLKRRVIPTAAFEPAAFRATFGGRILGLIEKTAPYRKCFFDPTRTAACRSTRSGIANEMGGAEIQFGFRVTDIEAVRRAGFVDSAGEAHFRWIQIIELRRIGGTVEPAIQALRKRGRGHIIDPTSALLPLDAHPYYWYENLPPGIDRGFHVNNYLNRQGPNRLYYDLLFYDRPHIPLAAAQPGRRAYFNFETALVGVRPTRRNVILNTISWGFDVVIVNGVPTLRFNALRAGPAGGSPAMRRVLSREIAAGSFPGHCFVGGGFSRAATCT